MKDKNDITPKKIGPSVETERPFDCLPYEKL